MNKGYSALCDYINGKSVTLIGAGVSNVPLVAYLYECGAKEVSVRDLKKSEADPEIRTVLENGGKVILSGDTHSKENLCYKFDEMEALAKNAGFKSFCTSNDIL